MKAREYGEKCEEDLMYEIGKPCYDQSDIEQAYLAGAAYALSDQWHDAEKEKPPFGKKVLCMTDKGNSFVSAYDDVKDIKGNHLGYYWRCNGKAAASIVAWMEIPEYKPKNK